MQDQPPVAELVAEAFHQERCFAGDNIGRGSLIVEQLPEVLRGIVGETQLGTSLFER